MNHQTQDERRRPIWFSSLPISNSTWCVLDDEGGVMYTGYGKDANVPFEDYKALRPDVQYTDLMSQVEVDKCITAWENENVIVGSMKVIDATVFEDAFECMPPGRQGRYGGMEHFFMCEPYTSNIYHWYLSKDGFYLELKDRSNVLLSDLFARFNEYQARCLQFTVD